MISPLHEILSQLGARFESVSGWKCPVHFGDVEREYRAAKQTAAVLDRSLNTLIEVRGPDRARFLHNLCTNDVKQLAAGHGCDAYITNVQGKILASVRIRVEQESIWLHAIPGAASGILAHLKRYLIVEKVELLDRSADFAQWLLIGPEAPGLLAKLASRDLMKLSHLDHVPLALGGNDCTVVRLDEYTVPCYLLISTAEQAFKSWAALYEMGQAIGISPLGEHAFEILRVESGVPDFGRDIDSSNFPQEVGRVDRAVSFRKGCYLGQEPIARIDALGHVNRSLVGLTIATFSEAVPAGTEIQAGDKAVGRVTSSVVSPDFGGPIALGYVRRGFVAPGTELVMDVAGRTVQAAVRPLPFQG